ncbi:recombinase family protein [Pelagibacterium montanilacus]|uniref:recombinase family protein n=1 Tax=Pelagibacterium montanilacus TaxID=2185280 RepID=UPI0013DF8D1E|nr:recombinase family protein [Pelagibacterium montanilacus]
MQHDVKCERLVDAMRKVAVYARYSSDLQRERSITDQFAHCNEYARRQGYVVVANYSDSAKSGASLHGRDGLAALMVDAATGKFDCIVVEALDRLSRDLGDLANLNKQLEFLGVTVEATGHGVASEVDIALRGLISSMFLKDLAHKVRRGLAGVVADGRHAGGLAYGYNALPGSPGELTINEEEAEIVRRIYQEYVSGSPPREIVHGLNHDGVNPPRTAKHWNASTLNGSAARGYGILRNPIYAGEIVWNRVRMVKDPSTGKRVSRTNPTEEWKRVEVPALRIVDEALFDAAKARNERKSLRHSSHHRRPKHMLSGLLKCAHCGGGMSVKDNDHSRVRIHCSTAKESGACASRSAVYLDEIEHRVIDGLVRELRGQEALRVFVAAYNAEVLKLRSELGNDSAPLQKRMATIETQLKRAVDLVVQGVVEEQDVVRTLADLKQERAAIERQLAAWQGPDTIQLSKSAADVYAETMADLGNRIATAHATRPPEALGALRALIDKVVIVPVHRAKPKIKLYGKLAELLHQPSTVGGISGSGGGT